jgi:hypothetical protein
MAREVKHYHKKLRLRAIDGQQRSILLLKKTLMVFVCRVVLLIIWRTRVRIMWHSRLQCEYTPASDWVFASLERAVPAAEPPRVSHHRPTSLRLCQIP